MNSLSSYSAIRLGDRKETVVQSIIYSMLCQTRAFGEDHIRILATLVPDEIIYRHTLDEDENVRGVLLFVDVSGFTDLCEKYNSLGKGGPSRLTYVLNAYMGAMVQEIMSYNGDILKFSGDAFIALWKSSDDISMTDVVHAAIDCALGIQSSHGRFETEVGVVLRVKIALAAGPITITIIGDSNFLILGDTMMEVKGIAGMCGPGEIVIAPSIKKFLFQYEYILEDTPNIHMTKILKVGPQWNPSGIRNQYDLFESSATTEQQTSDHDIEIFDMNDDIVDNKTAPPSLILRPSLDYAVKNNLNSFLRKFIIAPVVKAVDLNEPLDYLTEMRQVVIVFINIVINETLSMNNIIQLSHACYAIICNLANKKGGCVNKLSMFDKDLMFLVIFGARGFKHHLEAQRALYYALSTLSLLQKVPDAESVSIGVCTGMTYCGVVGHPIRREYTVIGRIVNKAARLMVKYPDMVSCDQLTFLQSWLHPRYFTKQPAKPLKGFSNVGPIYKFADALTNKELILKTNRCPILDRGAAMEEYFYSMSKHYGADLNLKFSQISLPVEYLNEDYSMIIVRSPARQGKTRFLFEIIYCLGRSFPYYYYSFSKTAEKQNFKLVQQIFEKTCGLNEKDIHKRTENVAKFMHPFKVPEFLCGLNDILGVNFPRSKHYLRLTDAQKDYLQQKLIKYLCIKGIKEKCLVFIDNIDYMDEKSWYLIEELLNKNMFLCATASKTTYLGRNALAILRRQDVKSINLRSIQKIYHGGLICQFLDVNAIDLEIERYIQVHSFGRPGWIESFLTTLCHSDGIKLVKMPQKEAIQKGLVIPPFQFIRRKNKDELMAPSVRLIESKFGTYANLIDLEIEDWTIYYQAIKDSDNLLTDNKSDYINVAIISNKMHLENLEIADDESYVAMIRKYDTLKFQEQLLLKCSSILGNSFSRGMLEYVMQSHSHRKNAQAIQRLFEIKVFSCARGKYTDGAIQINHYLTNPNDCKEIACYCTGFPTRENCVDLPKYANCGYISFRDPLFRKMLINLLTENQSNLYHVRAIWFLESQTRRCLNCGMGYFTGLIGHHDDDGMKKDTTEHTPTVIRTTMSIIFGNRGKLDSNYTTLNAFDRERIYFSIKDLKITQGIPETVRKTNVGILLDIYVRTFSDNNLINCECESILVTLYRNMIYHCQEIEDNEKLMTVLLEYATLCIKSENRTLTFQLLLRATELLDKKLQFYYPEPDWQVPLTRGKIMYLMGQIKIQNTSYEEAEMHLLKALKCYNLKFPTNVKIYTKIYEIKQKFLIEYLPIWYIGSKNEDVCVLADQTADVMSSLCNLYRRSLNFDKAYLACLWGLNEALRSNSNFTILCTAYANVLTMDLVYCRDKTIMDKIEDMAMEMCYRKQTRLRKYELEAVVILYGSIFCRRCLCYNMVESLKLGVILVQLISPGFGVSHRWIMLPLLVKALVFTRLTAQGALLVNLMSYYKTDTLTYAPMMYYLLCLEFRLYTTYSIAPLSDIKSQCSIELHDYSNMFLTSVHMRYDTGLWLWYIRRNDFDGAELFSGRIESICKSTSYMDAAMVYIRINVLEGILIIIVRQINICDAEGLKQNEAYAKNLLKYLRKITLRLTCLRSRYLLLKAYWCMIYKKERKAFRALNKASNFAMTCGVLYDVDWIEHTRNLWMQPKTSVSNIDEWRAATDAERLDTDWERTNIVVPFYNFILPENN